MSLSATLFADMKPIESDGYKLIWSDEFNEDGKLSNEWKHESGFQRNHELQWYQKDNAYCKGGLLVIEGRKEKRPNPNYNPKGNWHQKRPFIEYTSSSVFTKKSWQYGRFEIKARIKAQEGLWPAIWTLGNEGQWPSNGEIDIMEYYEGSILANLAWGTKKRWAPEWDTVKLPIESFGDPDFDKKFHIWRMDWTEKSVKIYLDGKLINSCKLSRTVNKNNHGPKNPFKQPHYLLLNLALGGRHGGDVSNVQFPTKYEIDYVRIYQKKNDSAKVKKP